MGNSIVPVDGQSSYIRSGRRIENVTINDRVALWQLPYNENYLQYDDDDSRWYESTNKWGENELAKAEKNLKINMEQYKVQTKTIQYNDDTYVVESRYPNKNIVTEQHGKNHVMFRIKNKFNQLVAEKLFNGSSNDGRKTVYKNVQQDENIFTIVQIYSYDTTKNRATDVVNYGYTSSISDFIKGCNLENEYYKLNGKEVKATKTDTGEYKVNSKNGKILTFLVE